MKLKVVLFLFGAALLTAIVALTRLTPQRIPQPQSGGSSLVAASDVSPPDNRIAEATTPARDSSALPARDIPTVPPAQPPPDPPADSTPVSPAPADAAQLVAALQEIGPKAPGVPITPEQADKFKQDLAGLVRQGPAAVPAIRDFLARNIDSDFAKFEGGDLLGFSSLRASLFDALEQIGGPDGQAAMVQALKTTAVPAEILELAKDLEGQAPGQYNDEIVNAAREAVEMSAANQLGSNVEVGPAFRILQNYGAFHSGALDDQKGSRQTDGQ
jgi:hypothetical protein